MAFFDEDAEQLRIDLRNRWRQTVVRTAAPASGAAVDGGDFLGWRFARLRRLLALGSDEGLRLRLGRSRCGLGIRPVLLDGWRLEGPHPPAPRAHRAQQPVEVGVAALQICNEAQCGEVMGEILVVFAFALGDALGKTRNSRGAVLQQRHRARFAQQVEGHPRSA